MKIDSSFTSRFRIELFVIAILVIVAVGIFAARHPFYRAATDARASATIPPQLGQGESLLVLPNARTKVDSFPELDFSFAWYNAMTQEIGPFAIALAKDLTPDSFAGIRLIVVPARAAAEMTEPQIALVEAAVSRGASLIVEMPSPAWGNLTAVRRKTQPSANIRHFTDAPNSPLPPQLRDALLNFPLDARIMHIDSLDNEALAPGDHLLELDGAIAHYHRALGAGHVFVLAFDMGQAITALQQGRPNDDFSVQIPDGESSPSPASLILNSKLANNFIPFADILKHHVFMSVWRLAPQPALWPFPNAEKSAVIVTHDVSDIGDKASFIAQDELKKGSVSTILASTENTTPTWLAGLSEHGHEVGALLLRPPAANSLSSIGIGSFKPIRSERNMASQRAIIANRAHQKVVSCRKFASAWNTEYTTTFRELTAARCQIDLSYAPGNKQYGYLFGSGFPFHPLDRAGRPFPIYEFPTLISDAAPDAVDPKSALQLVRDSAEIYHEPVVLNIAADSMMTHPHYQSMDAWLSITDFAKQSNIRMTTVQEFMQRFSIRKLAAISSVFHEQNKTLSIMMELPDSPDAYTLALPTHTRFGVIQNIIFDQNNYENITLANGGTQTLIPIISGVHKVIVHYN